MFAWITNKLKRLFNSSAGSPASWLIDWIRGDNPSDTGVHVTGQTCLRYAPVWYAVRKISGHVAQLPLVLYERTGERSKQRATSHPAYQVVKRRPNSAMTASVFRELLQYHALIWGNGRAVIVRDGRGDVVELVPLLPERTKTVLVNGQKWHVSEIVVDQASGQYETRKFRDSDVLHVIGLSYDGIAGFPLWDIAKNSWGLGAGAERHAGRFYRNNAVPGLILEAPPGVFTDDEEARKFLNAFRDAHEGLENASKTALLREGIKASKLSNTPQEAQAVETRLFQRQDVALWFLLEQILGDNASVSYNSLEQANLAYLVNCLNAWLVKWQEQCESKLLRPTELTRDTHYFKFSTGALLRSDMKTTYDTLSVGVRSRIITPNEAREVLDLDAIEGGDELANPAITPGSVGATTANQDQAADNAGQSADETAAVKQRLRAVIHARLAELAGVEKKRVADLAGDPAKLSAWYERWQQTLADALQPMALDALTGEQIAHAWVAKSQADGMNGWQERIDQLADALAYVMTGGV